MTTNIELTPEDVSILTMLLGMAAGVAVNQGSPKLAFEAIRLANLLHQNDPNWIPYHVPCDRS